MFIDWMKTFDSICRRHFMQQHETNHLGVFIRMSCDSLNLEQPTLLLSYIFFSAI